MKRALIHDILKRYWGYDSFRPRQEEIIMSVLDGRDTLGLLPTGGGKSLTFQVPAMVFEGITVVVTPLISLMKDQVDNLRAAGIRAVCLHSGLSRAEHRLALDRCRLGKAKLMYVSPEKLQSATFIDQLRSMDVSFLVVDEAHCISQWGYDFRPSYLKISLIRELFHDIPVLALTASATPVVVDDIMDKLGFKERNVYARSFSRDNLSYIVRQAEMKRALEGDSKEGVYVVNFFLDADGIEIGFDLNYEDGDPNDQGYVWVTAPFTLDEIREYASGSGFWKEIE